MRSPRRDARSHEAEWRAASPYLMLAPTIGLLVLFFLYPLVVAAKQSFYAWDLLTPPTFVGLAQLPHPLGEAATLVRAFRNTLAYSSVVAGSMSLGLSLALALDRPGKIRGVRARRGLQRVRRLVGRGGAALHVASRRRYRSRHAWPARARTPHESWLGDPDVALYTLAAVSVWKITGYAMIIFLAGLQDIPPVLHEAAALDGANRWRRFWHITWPLLRPSAVFVATTSLIISFQAFDVVRIMTQGGPVHATELFVYAIYEQIFMNLRVGRASALVVVFSVLILALTGLQLRVWRGRREA